MIDWMDGADPAVIRVVRPVSLGPKMLCGEARAPARMRELRLNQQVRPLVQEGFFV